MRVDRRTAWRNTNADLISSTNALRVLPRESAACREFPEDSRAYTYHVINRGNGRVTVFHKPQDYFGSRLFQTVPDVQSLRSVQDVEVNQDSVGDSSRFGNPSKVKSLMLNHFRLVLESARQIIGKITDVREFSSPAALRLRH
jgi:hypothetical protein